ncbi:MAG: sucrose synthase [Candidatus Margulisbacteria bacterium]|nr:sucrose synthase [Candidatus Margulisiibacteriota bacterium]
MSGLPIEIQKIKNELLIAFFIFIRTKTNNVFILRNDLAKYIKEFSKDKQDSYLVKFIYNLQEMIMLEQEYIAVYRYDIAKYHFYRFVPEQDILFENISIDKYLDWRDSIVLKNGEKTKLTLDFMPFYDYSPSIKDSNDLGNGIKFLSKYMSSNFFQNPNKWNYLLFEFLSLHSIEDQQLLLDSKIIKNSNQLMSSVRFILDFLEHQANEQSTDSQFWDEMDSLGFRMGWGNSPERVKDTMMLLSDCFNAPDSDKLDMFISRIPMISKIVLFSPHGWFGQKNVLGKPDTGGQVVYILDKVRYLEQTLKNSLHQAGISIIPKILVVTRLIPNAGDTDCNVPKEKIENTENSWIIRVPFRHSNGDIHQEWISRFHIWPFLETFAQEAKETVLKEFNGNPNLIVGNYSDGNLVATMLSKELGVMQCNIAHALEKSKYLFSDLYWQDMENDYNFSLQYTADLLSMNMASFIITSSFQEIAGTAQEQGQYESYLTYSLPGLYHVRNGVNLFHPKFNIVPPGVPDDTFFPYYEQERRDHAERDELNKIIFDNKDESTYGELEDKKRVPIFSLARIDKVKNLSGLIEIFGVNKELRKKANLIIITDKISLEISKDEEEKNEIVRMYELIKKYNLYKNIRWVGIGALSRKRLAEVYRLMADRKGVFVQPALFEAFGLTILESMSSGVPTFGTRFGGPSEIIKDGLSGILINPTNITESAGKINSFITAVIKDEKVWNQMSEEGIKRVEESFNWNLYTTKLLSLTRIYGFWKFTVSDKAKQKMWLYYDVVFDDLFRKRLPKEY